MIIGCDVVNGKYSSTILTSASLLRTSLEINTIADNIKCGIGGPLINLYGEVIGITFYDELCTPFLPTSIVSKCLENFNKDSFCRPWLGLRMTNLYAASLLECEKVWLRFPDISNGVFIEEVVEGSPAEHAGLCSNDIIIQFGGNPLKSFLELCGRMLEKTGVTVEIVLVRDTCHQPSHIAVKVDETSLENLNGWPLPKEFRKRAKRVR